MSERSLDKIHIRDLQARCIIGIYPGERREKQDVTVNITLHADLTKACENDQIEDTVDYKSIKKNVLAMVEDSSSFLLENLAEQAARICLEDERVLKVDVVVDKPSALRFAKSVAVEITRER